MTTITPIYLTGYRGTGKTTVGNLIGDALGWNCLDLDRLIESAAGQSIREIFAEGGEELFRDHESKCLREVCESVGGENPAVISLGGGAILREQNREWIRASGPCVWLTASPETLADRIAGDAETEKNRPSLTNLSPTEEIAEVLARREPLYRESADFEVATDDKTPGEIAAQVLEWLRQSAPDTGGAAG